MSEFETTEQAEPCDRGFRAKVAAPLADPRPPVPHDKVMAEIQAIIDAKKAAKQNQC